jgi:hypothetical protein
MPSLKISTLAECEYVIGSKESTFTEMVYWLGKLPVIIPYSSTDQDTLPAKAEGTKQDVDGDL